MNHQEKWLDWAMELPPLAEEKNTAEQIQMCFGAYRAERWTTLFD